MEKVDMTKLDIAIKYSERMAEGRNPVTNVPIEDDILDNPNIVRCMYFIKEVLEKVRENGGIIGGKREKQPALPFPTEVLDQFQYRQDQSITHVLKQIYEPVADQNVRKISVMKITAALKEEGYLLEEQNPATGKTRKVPGEKGKELGIYLTEREYDGKVYESVTYNQTAQEYIVRLFGKIAEEKE